MRRQIRRSRLFDRPRERPVAIFGGPGGGAIAADVLDAIWRHDGSLRPVGFLNDVIETGTELFGLPVLGRFDAWRALPAGTLFLAPLHKPKESEVRFRRIEELEIPADRWASAIDPRAAVSTHADVARGCLILPFVYVGPAVRIGFGTTIRTAAHVSHDAKLGDNCYIGGSAQICGYVNLGRGVHIAPGAVVQERVIVGDWSVVGLNALVTRDLAQREVIAGIPGRKLKVDGD